MKKFLAAFLGVVGFLLIGLVAAPFFLDINDYRDFLSRKLSDSLGYTVQLKGPITWGLMPSAHIAIQDVGVQSDHQTPLAHVDEAVVRLDLWPLLSRRLVIHSVDVSGPTVTLVQDRTGGNNWSPRQGNPTVESDGSSATGQSDPRLQLNIQKLTLQKGNFTFRQGDKTHTAQDVTVTFHPKTTDVLQGGVLSGSLTYQTYPMHFELTTDMDSGNARSFDGNIRVGDHAVTAQGSLAGVDRFDGRFSYQGPGQGGAFAVQKASGKIAANLTKKTYDVTGVSLHLSGDQTIDGRVLVRLSGAKPFVDATLKTGPVDLNRVVVGSAAPTTVSSTAPLSGSRVTDSPKNPGGEGDGLASSLNALKAFDGKVRFSAPKVTYGSYAFLNPDLAVSLQKGQLTVTSFSGNVMGGRLRASGTAKADARSDLKITLDFNVDDVAVTELVPPSKASTFYLSGGRLSANGSLTTRGTGGGTLRQNLNGTVAARLKDGVLTGVDVDSLADKLSQKITPQLIFDLIRDHKLTGSTPIQKCDLAVAFKDGIGRITAFSLMTKTIDGRGEGRIQLPQESLDITLGARLRAHTDWPAVAVRLYGPWANLSHEINTKEIEAYLLKKTVATVLKSGLDKELKGALGETKLGKVLDQAGLGDLLGRDAQESPAADQKRNDSGTDGGAQKKQMDPAALTDLVKEPEKAVKNILQGLF